jgi:hypothetical protein
VDTTFRKMNDTCISTLTQHYPPSVMSNTERTPSDTTGECRDKYGVFVGKSEGRRLLRKSTYRVEYNIRKDLKVTRWVA